MSSAVSGKKTFLIWNYSKVLEVSNISGPSQKRDTIDLTSHDSADGYREFIAGLADAGEISLEGNMVLSDALGQIAFHTDIQAGTARAGYIVLPAATGGAIRFTGIGIGFEPSFPDDSQIAVSGSLKVTGKPTLLTSGSAGLSALTGIEETDTDALTITPTPASGTYAYACTLSHTASDWVKLTVTCANQTVYINGELEATTVQSSEIALGAAGTTTDILIVVYLTAGTASPRLYTLSITRPAA